MKRSRRRSRAAARPSMRNARVDVAAVAVVADAAGTARIARNMLTGKLVMLVKLLLRRTKKIRNRSEEHTSELQSLMRTSYAVFCLKKKKTHKAYLHHTQLTVHDICT